MSSQFLAELELIFSGAQAGPANRWTACNFFDKVIFAQSSVPPVYWPKGGQARPVPGLPSSEGWDGVEEFAGHLMLWRGEIIKWSDLNDFTTWIPVNETAVTLRADTLENFTQPAPSQQTGWIHLNEDFGTFVIGQFVRIDLNEEDPVSATYNFYTVSDVADPTGKTASTIGISHSFPADGESYYAFTKTYVKWPTGGRLLVNGTDLQLEVTSTSRDLTGFFTSSTISDLVPEPGGTFRISLNENPSSLRVGDVLSVGLSSDVGLDLYEVVTVAFSLELRRLNVGTQKQALHYKFPVGTFLTFQPFLRAKNTGPTTKTVAPNSTLTVQGAVKLIPANLTGEIPEGATVPKGSTIASVDANEAGEAPNAGGQINGDIYAIVALGEYGTIFKERSIQSLQYVGRASGTFFARPEVLDEGLLSRYAWSRIADNKLVFWGHKEIYEYSGGLNLVPIGQQHTQTVFKELDRSRRDEIIVYHNESRQQVWFVYPTLLGETKVLIYNYIERSVVIDTYSNDLNGLTAVGAVDWEVAPTWDDLTDTQIWDTETKKWFEYVDDGLKRTTVIAIGGTPGDPNLGEDATATIPRMLLHGRVFSRAHADNCLPSAYYAYAETEEFDFNDPAAWKYVDTIQLNMEVRDPLERPMKMWVQLGSRNNLDSDIKWSTPTKVEVSGNGTIITKVNIRGSGRFHRIRFFSNEVGVQWRVAGFTLIARAGGTN